MSRISPYGSHRRLLEHSKQAVISAVELYNKPNFTYREPIISVLLVNAWELCFLALLSKNRIRIYQPKKRFRPYLTLELETSMGKSKKFFPNEVDKPALRENILLLKSYRNQATHYYHDEQSKHAIYALAQASVRNYRDFLMHAFGIDISEEINLVLLPLTFSEPPNFIEYFRGVEIKKSSPFITRLFSTLQSLDDEDTSRLITHCHIKLEHTNNIKFSDIVASPNSDSEANILLRNIDPNDSHPFLQNEIIGTKSKPPHKTLNVSLNSYSFQAIVRVHEIKKDKTMCWTPKKGGSSRYSPKCIEFLNNFSEEEIASARSEYRSRMRRRKR